MFVTRFAKYEDLNQIMALYGHLNPDDPRTDAQRLKEVWQDIMNHP